MNKFFGLTLATMVAGGVLAAATPAQAHTAASPTAVKSASALPASATDEETAQAYSCRGKTSMHILARYGGPSDQHRTVLRCGTSSWGYKHIAHRWSNNFESHLERTIKRPTIVRSGGGRYVLCRFVGASESRRWFKVVYTRRDISTKGIITAVWEGRHGTCEKVNDD